MVATPLGVGQTYDPVVFPAADGTALAGWLIPVAGSRGTILFCHGNAGNISHRTDYVRIFTRMRLSLLLFDYRGYGQSSGSPDERGTYDDAAGAWRFLVEQRHIRPDEIILFGESLGGAIAAWLSTERQPAALITQSCFTSLPDLGSRIYPFLPVRWLLRHVYDARGYIARARCPVLVIHSPEDEIVPYDQGRALFEAAAEPKRFLEIRGDHNGGFLLAGGLYTEGIESFLAEHLHR
jgi:hypothetical protein